MPLNQRVEASHIHRCCPLDLQKGNGWWILRSIRGKIPPGCVGFLAGIQVIIGEKPGRFKNRGVIRSNVF